MKDSVPLLARFSFSANITAVMFGAGSYSEAGDVLKAFTLKFNIQTRSYTISDIKGDLIFYMYYFTWFVVFSLCVFVCHRFLGFFYLKRQKSRKI